MSLCVQRNYANWGCDVNISIIYAVKATFHIALPLNRAQFMSYDICQWIPAKLCCENGMALPLLDE
jgi:hypothetical protein